MSAGPEMQLISFSLLRRVRNALGAALTGDGLSVDPPAELWARSAERHHQMPDGRTPHPPFMLAAAALARAVDEAVRGLQAAGLTAAYLHLRVTAGSAGFTWDADATSLPSRRATLVRSVDNGLKAEAVLERVTRQGSSLAQLSCTRRRCAKWGWRADGQARAQMGRSSANATAHARLSTRLCCEEEFSAQLS